MQAKVILPIPPPGATAHEVSMIPLPHVPGSTPLTMHMTPWCCCRPKSSASRFGGEEGEEEDDAGGADVEEEAATNFELPKWVLWRKRDRQSGLHTVW